MIRETYKWIVAPMQEAVSGKGLSELRWEHFQLNPGAPNWQQEIERVLKENEVLITEWAPIHLAAVLKNWFWKEDAKDVSALSVWQQTCQQLYLPRLKDDNVFRQTLGSAAESRDFFGFAQGKADDGMYLGFSFGQRTIPILDGSLLLIEPIAAGAYAEAQETVTKAAKHTVTTTTGSATLPTNTTQQGTSVALTTVPTPPALEKRFFGQIELDPIQAKRQFADIVDEVILQFTSKPGITVTISVDIRAEATAGIDETTQRAVRENCRVLRIKGEFE
jgi:hypothetical protein